MKNLFIAIFAVAIVSLAITALAVNTTTSYTAGTELPRNATEKVYTMESTVAFGTGAGSGDIYKCIYIPAKCVLVAVGAEVVTVAGNAAAAFSLGDSTSNSLFVAATAATNASFSAVAPGKAYSAANYVQLVTTAVCTGGTVRVRAVIADLSK